MKKRIVTAVITACLALCAAVWPQPDTRGERPAPIPTHAATAPKTDAVTTAEKKNTGRADACGRNAAAGACASHTAADHRAAARR